MPTSLQEELLHIYIPGLPDKKKFSKLSALL
jgi:hypothetical protein